MTQDKPRFESEIKNMTHRQILEEYARSVSQATKEANTMPPPMKLVWHGIMNQLFDELLSRLDQNYLNSWQRKEILNKLVEG